MTAPDPGLQPTARQWVAKWNTLSIEVQEQTARRILAASEDSARCFTEDHREYIRHLLAETARLRLQVDARDELIRALRSETTRLIAEVAELERWGESLAASLRGDPRLDEPAPAPATTQDGAG